MNRLGYRIVPSPHSRQRNIVFRQDRQQTIMGLVVCLIFVLLFAVIGFVPSAPLPKGDVMGVSGHPTTNPTTNPVSAVSAR